MDLSIIIVSYNVRYFLEQCLFSIYGSKGNFEYEVFVVDNASKDGSVNYIRHRFPHREYPTLHVIENVRNVGFGRANNQALERAKGKYVLFSILIRCWQKTPWPTVLLLLRATKIWVRLA